MSAAAGALGRGMSDEPGQTVPPTTASAAFASPVSVLSRDRRTPRTAPEGDQPRDRASAARANLPGATPTCRRNAVPKALADP